MCDCACICVHLYIGGPDFSYDWTPLLMWDGKENGLEVYMLGKKKVI